VFASRTTRCTPLLSTTFHRITFLATANHFLPLGAPIVVSFFRLSSGMFENEKKTFGVRACAQKNSRGANGQNHNALWLARNR
jgi:hypothetical protein